MDKNSSARQLAKNQALLALTERAKVRGFMTYSELAEKIEAVRFEAHGGPLNDLLRDISRESDAAGEGMISALVVRKSDGQPGLGFFKLARSLGKNTSDLLRCWVEEFKRVHARFAED